MNDKDFLEFAWQMRINLINHSIREMEITKLLDDEAKKTEKIASPFWAQGNRMSNEAKIRATDSDTGNGGVEVGQKLAKEFLEKCNGEIIMEEALKIRNFVSDSIYRDARIFSIHAEKLRAYADIIWMTALIKVYGNVKVEWRSSLGDENNLECHLPTGEVFK